MSDIMSYRSTYVSDYSAGRDNVVSRSKISAHGFIKLHARAHWRTLIIAENFHDFVLEFTSSHLLGIHTCTGIICASSLVVYIDV